MPANVLEENSRQMDRTLIGNTKVCAEVHALQSGGELNVGDGPAQLSQILRRHTTQGFVHHYTDYE